MDGTPYCASRQILAACAPVPTSSPAHTAAARFGAASLEARRFGVAHAATTEAASSATRNEKPSRRVMSSPFRRARLREPKQTKGSAARPIPTAPAVRRDRVQNARRRASHAADEQEGSRECLQSDRDHRNEQPVL